MDPTASLDGEIQVVGGVIHLGLESTALNIFRLTEHVSSPS
jgi:hypothetical protein